MTNIFAQRLVAIQLILILLLGGTIFLTPKPVSALSCEDPIEYFESLLNGSEGGANVAIFTATPIAESSHPNHDGRLLEIDTVYKGVVPEKQWVYYYRDEEWGYYCVGGPSDLNTKTLYVIGSNSTTGRNSVSMKFRLTSERGQEVLELAESANVSGRVIEFQEVDRMQYIARKIKFLINEIRILLAEFRYWQDN